MPGTGSLPEGGRALVIFGIILANKCTTVLRLLPVCRVRVDER